MLEKGRVVEQGTHEQLRRSGGFYSVFAEEQRIERELQALEGEPVEPAPVGSGEEGASP